MLPNLMGIYFSLRTRDPTEHNKIYNERERLDPKKIFTCSRLYQWVSNQCDQMTRLFVLFWAIYNNENFAKFGSKFSERLMDPQKFLKFHQSGKSSPYLWPNL